MENNTFPIITDTFKFECTRCGNCCTGDQQVFLNPFDLMRMASFLKLASSKELFDRSLVRLVQGENRAWLPQMRFKNKPFRFCPFLINEEDDQGRLLGLCRLHPYHKPLICSLAPVGRRVDLQSGKIDYLLVSPAPDCPGVDSDVKNRLSDVLKVNRTGLSYQTRFFKLLRQALARNWPRQKYLQEFYTFSIMEEFEDILSSMEKAVTG